MAASAMETGVAEKKAEVLLHRIEKAVSTSLLGRWFCAQTKGMICIFLSKIKCVEDEGSWMWKHSPCNTTQGQKVIRNRANSRAKQSCTSTEV